MSVDSHREAELDFIDAINYYNQRVSSLGNEFFNEVQSSFKLINTLPDSGSPGKFGTRKTQVNKFPFEIVYVKKVDKIVVLAIKHFRRRTDYWMDRNP